MGEVISSNYNQLAIGNWQFLFRRPSGVQLLYILFGAGDEVLLCVACVSHMTWEPQKKTATGPRSGVTPLADPSREPTDRVGQHAVLRQHVIERLVLT